jgi:DNA-binding XRE family transcriptional regulator
MAYNNVVYPLLRVKMAEINLDIKTMAEGVEMNRMTLSRKLGGKYDLLLPEAYRIRDRFFPDQKIDDLFDRNYRPRDRTA